MGNGHSIFEHDLEIKSYSDVQFIDKQVSRAVEQILDPGNNSITLGQFHSQEFCLLEGLVYASLARPKIIRGLRELFSVMNAGLENCKFFIQETEKFNEILHLVVIERLDWFVSNEMDQKSKNEILSSLSKRINGYLAINLSNGN